MLPERDGRGELNPARTDVLEPYFYAVPAKLRRRRGVHLPADKVIGLLLERLDLHEQLSRQLARVCRGAECPHITVCPFADIMRENTEHDGILCAVEREHIRHWVDNFVEPEVGKPKVDPRKPEMGFMFRQLMQYVVQQLRYSMHMQSRDIVGMENTPVRQSDGSEQILPLNEVEYPLMAGWQRVTDNIQKTMQRMGLTPEFQMRQGTWGEDEMILDAEERAKELAREYLADVYDSMLEEADPGSTEHQLLESAVREARELAEEEAKARK
jgi:hypothetical protein